MNKTKYTVTSNDAIRGSYTTSVYFDGVVYRWLSNDRVPPTDSCREFGIDQLPGFDVEAMKEGRYRDIIKFLASMKPKKKRTTIKEQAEQQIESAKKAVQNRICALPAHPMGHAFLWGTVEVVLKNGKSRFYKACLGSVCVEDLSEAVRLANQVTGVSNVFYNLD
jgi:hypothetical protein